MARGPSVVELLGAGIEALTHADATQLEGLAEAARRSGLPQTAQEQRAARQKLRTLAMLIGLTKRNLRLLRGTARLTPLDG